MIKSYQIETDSDGEKFCPIQITFNVTKHHLIAACVFLKSQQKEETRQSILEAVKYIILHHGQDMNLFLSAWEYDNIYEAMDVAKKVYHDFF